jgi:hypothetical protein
MIVAPDNEYGDTPSPRWCLVSDYYLLKLTDFSGKIAYGLNNNGGKGQYVEAQTVNMKLAHDSLAKANLPPLSPLI